MMRYVIMLLDPVNHRYASILTEYTQEGGPALSPRNLGRDAVNRQNTATTPKIS